MGILACATPIAAPDAESVAVDLTGQTGALAVTTANTIVNQYGVLAANAAAGATTITVTNPGDFTATGPFATALAAGDLLMIYQPQGATIDATDTATYGNVTVLGSAGRYELVHVTAVAGPLITLETGCGGLKAAYTTAGATEVIRVPQLTTLAISGAGSITARPWDGARGGVVAIQAQTSAAIGGAGIDVSGRGFRGGAADDVTTGPPGTTTIRSPSNATGAEKGESIAGFEALYDSAFNGRYGRGAAANGGGGGDAHNAGGGGGANGNTNNAWTGAGVMSAAVVGAAAWNLDPDFVANGNARTNSSGGGRGGYTYSGADQDALAVAPGTASWAGDSRRDVGGLGGRPVANDPATRLFLGGGGGAGDGNNEAAGPGGAGGGLVLLIAPTVTGAGAIAANGANGTDAMHNPGDAPGGGGAGGTIVVASNALSGIAIHANGGIGGNQTLQAALEAEGPGGGGGGGFVAMSGGALAATATGSLGGTTNAPTLAEFPANGATSGATGIANGVVTTLSACVIDDLSIANTDGKASVVAGTVDTYTVTVANAGADVVAGATVTENFPATLTGVTWTCVASAGGSCPAMGSGNIAATITIANGGTVVFTITGTIAPSATGTIATTATVAAPAGVTDPGAPNNTATDTDQITVSADLAIAVTDSVDPIAPGGSETYTVTVTNAGPSTATGLTVTDTLPAGATFTSAMGTGWTCNQAAGIVTCTDPSLAPGSAPPIAIVVTMPMATGTVTDTARIAAASADPMPANNMASQSTTVQTTADLAIAVTDAPDPVAPGGALTYTVTVTDLGPGAATNLTVTDTLPAGATFVSAMGTGWTCMQAAGVVTCTRPALAVGVAPPIAIVIMAPNASGTISDTATIAATSADPTPGNNSATQMTTVAVVVLSTDLSITLTDNPDPVVAAQMLTYTATVVNNGAIAAAALTVTDTIPAGTTFVSAMGTGWTCAQTAGTVTCTLPALAAGATASPIAIVVTAPNEGGMLSDTATVAATTPDPTPANNTATQTTTVTPSSDLTVVVTGTPDPIMPGGTETFTVTVTNSGPSTATGITVTETIPPGSTFVSAMGTGWTCTQSGNVVTCTRPSLPPGGAPPITIVVTMPSTPGMTTTTTGVTSTTPDPDAGNNTTSTTTTVATQPGADLAITLAATPDPVAPGATLTYGITVTNLGPDPAANATVTDTLPAGATVTSAGGVNWNCAVAGLVVTCTRAAIPLGVASLISIIATAPTMAGPITDTASITATTADPALANNMASITTNVSGSTVSADLAISLSDDGPVAERHTLTYTLSLADLGPGMPTGIVVRAELPAPVTAVSASTEWSCATSDTSVMCTAGVLPTTTVEIQITAPSMEGPIVATATVTTTTNDPVADNNKATDTATVVGNLTVRGGGCDAGGGSTGVLVLLAFGGLLLRKKRVALIVALSAPAIASAQSAESFPVERMRISTDRDGILGVEWAGAPAPWAWNIGTWLGFADNPLVIADRDSGDRVQSLVHRRLGGSLFGAVGITSWLELGVEMPLVYAQNSSGMTMESLASPTLGDLRLAPKLVLRDGRGDRLAVAVMVGFTLPTSGSGYAGESSPTFDPELILSKAWGAFRLTGNLGYLARKTETYMDLTVDDELYARLGASYRFDSPLELDLTAGVSTAAAKPFGQVNTDPFEVDLAAQYDLRRDRSLTLFGLTGFGIGGGFGSPDFRAVLGVRYTRVVREPVAPPPPIDDDPDHDGIRGAADKCPNEPEDFDGFQDADGCPDPDNDNDGIPDVDDKCPNEPEDKDGFEDLDGCPDPDNDKDGILDVDDKCPNEPGPASNQGCPDPDRDGDGVPDRIDNCPDEPGPVENHGCANKQLVTINNGKLELVDRVYFRTDKDIIEVRSNAILDNVAKVLVAHPEIAHVRVEGHTDNRGGAAHNLDLSGRRSAAVVKYLVKKGVARDRLDAQGFGQDKPIADNTTDVGRATNRRVEFVIEGAEGVDTKATGPDSGTIGK